MLNSGIQDAVGRHLPDDEFQHLARQAIDAGLSPASWFQQHGSCAGSSTSRPLALTLLAAAVWLVRRAT